MELFNKINNGFNGEERWSPDLGRIDVAATYRLTTHAQLKLQYSYQYETTAPHQANHLLATQFTVRF